MNPKQENAADSGEGGPLERIREAVNAEYEDYKQTLCAAPAEHVFQQAYHIHLVEEVTFVIRDCPEGIEDDEFVLMALEQLAAGKQVLSAFLNWADDDDYVNVSNAGTTAEALRDFCAWWQEEQKGGAAQ
jgi:hypothetical protein